MINAVSEGYVEKKKILDRRNNELPRLSLPTAFEFYMAPELQFIDFKNAKGITSRKLGSNHFLDGSLK